MNMSSSASFFLASGFGFGAPGNVINTILMLSLLPCKQITFILQKKLYFKRCKSIHQCNDVLINQTNITQ